MNIGYSAPAAIKHLLVACLLCSSCRFVSALEALRVGRRNTFGNETSSTYDEVSSFFSTAGSTDSGIVVPARAMTNEKGTVVWNRALACPAGTIECIDRPGYCTKPEFPLCCLSGRSCQSGATCCTNPDHCSVSGAICCGTASCASGTTCCSGKGCAVMGGACCGVNGKFCSPGQTCCGDPNGCADPGNSCCGNLQCRPDEQCCNGGDGCAPKTGSCCGPKNFCREGYKCCKDDDGDLYCAPVIKPGGTATVRADGCLDTVTTDLAEYPGMDDIFENMCRGIKLAGRQGNEMLLEYIGRGNPGGRARLNRVAAGCWGPNRLNCVELFGEGSTCDEWPPATSFQGGVNASIRCVPGNHNRVMGGKWSAKVKGRGRNTIVRHKIKGIDCDQVSLEFDPRKVDIASLYKRAVGGAILLNTTDAIYLDGNELYGSLASGKVAIIVPLAVPGDFVGQLTYTFTIAEGGLKPGGVVVDDGGDEYGAIAITSKGQSASRTIDIDDNGNVGNLFLLAWADDTKASIKAAMSLWPSTTTTAATN